MQKEHVADVIHAFAISVANEPQTGEQPPRVFYVGGTVRDQLRLCDPHDIDLEVYGVSVARVHELLEKLIGKEDVQTFGATFGIYRIACSDGDIDIALPRKELKQGKGHKGFSISGDPYLSFEQALRRRDFTINAILTDVLTGEIIDPYAGRDDIVHGILRVVNAKTFPEDPLRIFRGMQFVARFDYVVDQASMEVLHALAASSEIHTLSPERITAEWRKMLAAPFAYKGLRFLEETGLLARYPELDCLRTTEQDPGWHPEGSVWEHVMLSYQIPIQSNESEFDVVSYRLALLLHDIGKGSVTKKVGKNIVYDGHAEAGVEIAKVFFDRFTFGDACEQDVLVCVRFHEELPRIYRSAHMGEETEAYSANALRVLWRSVGVERIPLFLAVCEANARGRDLSLDDRPYPVRVWAQDLSERYHLIKAAAEPLLTGTDVQNIALRLNVTLPKGKKFGILLADIESARDRGEIVTRHDAIGYLESLLRGVGGGA